MYNILYGFLWSSIPGERSRQDPILVEFESGGRAPCKSCCAGSFPVASDFQEANFYFGGKTYEKTSRLAALAGYDP